MESRRGSQGPSYSRTPRGTTPPTRPQPGRQQDSSKDPHEQLPLPKEIYIRRRIFVGVIALLLVGILWWIIAAIAGGSEQDTATETTTATTTATATTTTTSSAAHDKKAAETTDTAGEHSETALASPTTTVTSILPQKDTCTLADLVITATSDKASYNPGEAPKFYMTISNPTTADCTINLDEELLRFEVYDLATNRRVWSDVDCNSSEGEGERTFTAGKDVSYEAVWSRTESAPGACSVRPEAPAGGYYLHALIGDNHSDALTFNLNPAVGL
ncbi:hypothetical protein ACFPVT_10525 [Corynebacterium choanae]|uniref:Uncharacterized protein n=1 Tax=Corynebacterium choanae TaxID=1862358 RepID=A0A3G6J4D1_9CORY|nr:hypothetical protein [Corynebacterium choanae]AZA12762.1 hypothetical protein CCHOA_01670 [Corynebacterium choanae]